MVGLSKKNGYKFMYPFFLDSPAIALFRGLDQCLLITSQLRKSVTNQTVDYA
jgi:hypothetical protein